MFGFCPLASGSKGNAVYIGSKNTKILVDAGISAKGIKERLEKLDVSVHDIDAIIVSHEHQDHIQALKVLAFKLGIPVIANYETAKAICTHFHDCPKFKIFSTGEPFEFNDLEIQSFSIKHDAVDPVGFSIRTDALKVGICTDLGFVTHPVAHHLASCDILYVEANHEPNMVWASSRPIVYKERVLGPCGHLSNEACGELVSKVYHPGLKSVYLAHLSTECNTKETALRVVGDILNEKKEKLALHVAHQDIPSRPTLFD